MTRKRKNKTRKRIKEVLIFTIPRNRVLCVLLPFTITGKKHITNGTLCVWVGVCNAQNINFFAQVKKLKVFFSFVFHMYTFQSIFHSCLCAYFYEKKTTEKNAHISFQKKDKLTNFRMNKIKKTNIWLECES